MDFRISVDVKLAPLQVEGEAFDQELQQRRKLEKQRLRQEEEAARLEAELKQQEDEELRELECAPLSSCSTLQVVLWCRSRVAIPFVRARVFRFVSLVFAMRRWARRQQAWRRLPQRVLR